jgi:uncharacterized protein (TIGR02217 family)
MASFIETPRFPDNLSYGSQGGPQYLTGVAVLQSGHEQRRAVWSTPRHSYNASFAVKTRDDINQIREYFHSMQGRFNGFRFKDWNDFTSASDGIGAHAQADQTIGIGDAILVAFQLRKNYTSGTETLQRTINKPVTGGILVEVDGVLQADPGDYTYDSTTGLVTFGVAPASPLVVKAGFEFDVPVRFDIDQLSVSADTFDIRSADIPIIELRI